MNFKLLRLPILLLFVFFSRSAFAQCEYTLNMFDTFGDGWSGGTLVISSGTSIQSYTLNNFNDDGIDSTLTFTVTVGEPLTIFWSPGFFANNECSFTILDYSGTLVYEDTDPAAGPLYTGVGTCQSCITPGNIHVENIYDTRVKLRWTPWSVSPGIGWYVIYGPIGFVPGPGVGDTLHVTTPKATLTGLQKKTGYDYYLLQDCGAGDFSALAGPFSFETYWSNDVGAGPGSSVTGERLRSGYRKSSGTIEQLRFQSSIPPAFPVQPWMAVDAGVAKYS